MIAVLCILAVWAIFILLVGALGIAIERYAPLRDEDEELRSH